jgi:hypothetical protein
VNVDSGAPGIVGELMTPVPRIHFGAVIRQVLKLYKDQAVVWLPYSVFVFGVAGLFTVVLMKVSPLMIYVSFLVSDIAIALFTAVAVELVAGRREDRHPPGMGEMLGRVTPVFGRVLLVALITGIGVFVGFVVLVIPGLVLATVWAVAVPVVVREQSSGLRALGRSRELVRGNWGAVFGVIFVTIFAVGLVTSGADLAASSASSVGGVVVRIVLEVFAAPVGALASVVLYLDLSAGELGALSPGELSSA